jgi:hypothetical protein
VARRLLSPFRQQSDGVSEENKIWTSMVFNKIRRLDTTAVVEHHIVAVIDPREAARRPEAECRLHWELGVIWDLDRRTSRGRMAPSRPVEGLEVEGEAEVELQILRDPIRSFVSIF